MNTSKVWYVTGASQGLGLILVRKLLQSRYRVTAMTAELEEWKGVTISADYK